MKKTALFLAMLSSLHAFSGEDILRDIPYGESPLQTMDAYLPADPKGPVIFMVHGGAWRLGDKSADNVVKNKVERWVSRGFVFVSVNYRLLPDADPVMQAGDVAKAFKLARDKARSWGADPSEFILMGHSAGAHLAALVASDPSRYGLRPWPGTVELDSAALDVSEIMNSRHPRFYDRAFGDDPQYWKNASPVENLSRSAAPILAVCSTRRRNSCSQARQFADKGKALGVRIEVLPEDLSHMEINERLGTEGIYTDSVESFMGSLSPEVRRLLK